MSDEEYRIKRRFLRFTHLHHKPIDTLAVSCHEANWYRQNFDEYFTNNSEALPKKYLRLINGLDDESCSIIQIILSRLMILYMNNWPEMLFEATAFESQELKKIREELDSMIICFPNDIFAYKHFLMPLFEDHAPFYSKIFIEELDLHKIRGKDIIDVGGFTGDTALVFSDYTDKKVYAFEPSPRHMKIMLETVKLNNTDKIIPVPLGLGDMDADLYMPDRLDGGASFTDKGLSVKITSLDEWVKHNNVEIGMIKVDIEGYEQKLSVGGP
jgi:FkbM family methyltransferase